MPYMKRGFTVVNMPEGIEFRKPFTYGPKQLRLIMKAKDSISFVLNESTKEDRAPVSTSCDASDPLLSSEALRVLSEVVEKTVAERALGETHTIEEQDIEVINLQLQQEDRLILQGYCCKYFTEDAKKAFSQNLQHLEDCSTILPVLNDAPSGDEPFWLFYCTSSASKMARIKSDEIIPGFWLNLIPATSQGGRMYELLINHPDSIKGFNVIRSDMGIVYYTANLELQQGTNFAMPDCFHKTIISVLHAQGFM